MDSKFLFLAALGGFSASASAVGHINFIVINLDDLNVCSYSNELNTTMPSFLISSINGSLLRK
jgi:hypothetical protein